MVTLTIFVEGGSNLADPLDSNLELDDVSSESREAFNKLLSGTVSQDSFQLVVIPIGSVTRAPKIWRERSSSRSTDLMLIDLDGPPEKREERIRDNYPSGDSTRIFFKVQRTEAWMLSQPEAIEAAMLWRGALPRQDVDMVAEIQAIQGTAHLEYLPKPDDCLAKVLRRKFEEKSTRRSKRKPDPWEYKKGKDQPAIISRLDFNLLAGTFSEAASLARALQGVR